MMENLHFYWIAYLLNLLLLAAGFFHSFHRRRVYSLFWLALAMFHILSSLQLGRWQAMFAATTLVTGQWLMVLGNTLLLMGTIIADSLILGRRGILKSRGKAERRDPAGQLYFAVMIVLILVAIGLRLRNGLDVAFSDWEAERSSIFSFLDTLSNLFGFIFYPSIWLAIRSRRWILSVALAAIGVVFFQFSGSRAMLLTTVCAVFLDLLRWQVPFSRKALGMFLLAVVGFSVHTVARAIRGLGLAVFLSALLAGQIVERIQTYYSIVEMDVSGGESDIYELYYYVVEKNYQFAPYRAFPTLKRLALLYVPRSLFPNLKPEDITYQIWRNNYEDGFMDDSPYRHQLQQMYENKQDGCLPPIVWGDALSNAGVAGLFLYPFLLSTAVCLLELLLTRLRMFSLYAIAPIIGVGYLMVARGAVIVGAGHIGYMLPLIFVVFLSAGLPLFRSRSYRQTSITIPKRHFENPGTT